MSDEHTSSTPLERITDLETDTEDLRNRMEDVKAACKLRDPISPRMLALATVLGLLTVLCLLGALKILTSELIAAILGAVAGRLTSNIGGSNDSEGGKKS